MKEVERPAGVGPHEGRELELMLAGTKPMAMFYDAVTVDRSMWLPEADFAPHVEAGRFVRRDEIYESARHDIPAHYVYYALMAEQWRIEAAHRIQVEIFVDGRPATDQDDIALGRLLGYTEAEINAFIGWRHRNGRCRAAYRVD